MRLWIWVFVSSLGCNQDSPSSAPKQTVSKDSIKANPKPVSKPTPQKTIEQGAVIRGDVSQKRLALVFSGDQYSDGTQTILQHLDIAGVKASFFFTGRYYRNPAHKTHIQTLKQNGHYLGAHSDQHLLYGALDNRDSLLVDEASFKRDLTANYATMKTFGISPKEARYFLPPYEWSNKTIAAWTQKMNLQLIGFTPGTRSNADYTTPDLPNYISSAAILSRIKAVEKADPNGLNGFILLMHVGTAPARTDKLYQKLNILIEWLKAQGYTMVRIDELLGNNKISTDQKPFPAKTKPKQTAASPPTPAQHDYDGCHICQRLREKGLL